MGFWKIADKMPGLRKFESTTESTVVLQLRADRGQKLAGLIAGADYQLTIGAILKGRKDRLIDQLSRGGTVPNVEQIQAELAVLRSINEEIDAAIRDGARAAKELEKQKTKEGAN